MNENESFDETLAQLLLCGDLQGAEARLDALAAAAPDDTARVRAVVARGRLLTALGRRPEARDLLRGLEPAPTQRDPAAAALVALELATAAAEEGDLAGARARLAAASAFEGPLPDDAILRAVTKVAALAALQSGVAFGEAGALLTRLSPNARAGVEANLLLAEGRVSDARDLLTRAARQAERAGAQTEHAGLLVHLGALTLASPERGEAVHPLKEARAAAVAIPDPLLYATASALLAVAYWLQEDRVNTYAACVRALVSLEDLLGPGAGNLFHALLETLRAAWGDEAYREAAEAYVDRRKKGAIE
jgi:hypothetical protein